MKTTLIALTCAVTLALTMPSAAQNNKSQLQLNTQRALEQYGYRGVDVSSLSTRQMAQITFFASSDFGTARIKGQIGAVLRKSGIRRSFN
ncbi:MAG: hypothetical protein ABJ327_16250 [Litoreibacter sp.]